LNLKKLKLFLEYDFKEFNVNDGLFHILLKLGLGIMESEVDKT
jgi:hypothetical protein